MIQSASEMREQAKRWRSLIVALVSIEAIAGFGIAIVVANGTGTGFNLWLFLGVVTLFVLSAFLAFMPHFMIVHTMQGVASILDQLPRPPRESRSSRGSYFSGGTQFHQAYDTPLEGRADVGPSVEARRVAGAIGALGGATRQSVAEKLDMDLTDVDRSLAELRNKGFVKSPHDGIYRYVAAATETRTRSVFCEDCGYTTSESLVERSHNGHRVREIASPGS